MMKTGKEQKNKTEQGRTLYRDERINHFALALYLDLKNGRDVRARGRRSPCFSFFFHFPFSHKLCILPVCNFCRFVVQVFVIPVVRQFVQ